MGKTLLVAVDDAPQSDSAVSFVNEEWPDAEVHLLTVIDPSDAGYSVGTGIPTGAEKWFESAKAHAEEILTGARETVDSGQVSTAIEVGRPARSIIDYAESHEVDHIVVGSHGRTGVSRILLGSVAEAVVRNAPVPVTVVR